MGYDSSIKAKKTGLSTCLSYLALIILAVVHDPAVTMGVQISFQDNHLFPLGVHPEVGLLDCGVVRL